MTTADTLASFLDAVVTLHDDRLMSVEDDRDHYARHTLLLPVAATVLNSLDGHGESVLRRIDDFRGGPVQDRILASDPTDSLLVALTRDEHLISELAVVFEQRRLAISPFYADRRELHEIRGLIASRAGYRPELIPSTESFKALNDKIAAKERLVGLGIKTPPHALADSHADVQAALRTVGRPLVVKHDHEEIWMVLSDEQARALPDRAFPAIVEAFIAPRFSPIAHWLQYHGERRLLFVVGQRLSGMVHTGNYSLTALSAEALSDVSQTGERLLDSEPKFEGVIAVDFIADGRGQMWAVDVNPRFNASTYAFAALCLRGYSGAASYQELDVNLPSLADLVGHHAFPGLQGEDGPGCLLFGPVLSPTGGVRRFCILTLAGTLGEALNIERVVIALAQGIARGNAS
jgi:hypothetical protein